MASENPHISWLVEQLDGQSFANCLSKWVDLTGCSLYAVAELGRLDRPYLHRLVSGTKTNPSQSTVIRIGTALTRLGADITCIDELLASSGQLPVFVFHGVVPLNNMERRQIEKTKKKHQENDKKRR